MRETLSRGVMEMEMEMEMVPVMVILLEAETIYMVWMMMMVMYLNAIVAEAAVIARPPAMYLDKRW